MRRKSRPCRLIIRDALLGDLIPFLRFNNRGTLPAVRRMASAAADSEGIDISHFPAFSKPLYDDPYTYPSPRHSLPGQFEP